MQIPSAGPSGSQALGGRFKRGVHLAAHPSSGRSARTAQVCLDFLEAWRDPLAPKSLVVARRPHGATPPAVGAGLRVLYQEYIWYRSCSSAVRVHTLHVSQACCKLQTLLDGSTLVVAGVQPNRLSMVPELSICRRLHQMQSQL